MAEWQPIETAPKDGSRMLLWMPLGKGQAVYIGGYDKHWTGQCWVSENPRIPSSMTPAGWMPLPNPPAHD